LTQRHKNVADYPQGVAVLWCAQHGTDNHGLLQALLTTTTLDEISNANDFAAVQNYVKYQAKADVFGRTTVGLVFWVYPTGLYGPYHQTEDHRIKQHGILLTVEPGALVADVVNTARAGLVDGVIVHHHISGRLEEIIASTNQLAQPSPRAISAGMSQ
jgi:hypothetical protein